MKRYGWAYGRAERIGPLQKGTKYSILALTPGTVQKGTRYRGLVALWVKPGGFKAAGMEQLATEMATQLLPAGSVTL